MMIGMNLSMASNPSQVTVIQQAIAVLRKFGSDAHVYLPGVGMLNGLQAANYIDSAGTQQGAVDQPVGLALDAAGGLGVELVVNGGLDSATGWTPVASAVTGGSLVLDGVTVVANGTALLTSTSSVAFGIGKTYQVTHTVSGRTTSYTSLNVAGVSGTPRNGNGTFTEQIVATTSSTAVVIASRIDAGRVRDGSIDNISVREVTGIAASQPTTASKPILRRDAGGRYYWQFDGSNDSLSLGGPLFQTADDHCVVAGFNAESVVTGNIFFNGGSDSTRVVSPFVNAGPSVSNIWRDGAGTGVLQHTNTIALNQTYVLSGRRFNGLLETRLNGVLTHSGAVPAFGAAVSTAASIGNNVANGAVNFKGSIYPAVAIKGALSDSDQLLINKLVANLSGVSI